MRRPAPLLTVLALLNLLALGCDDGGDGGSASSGDPTPGDVTFHKDVEPILQASCLNCHTAGRIGGFSLLTYEEASPMSSAIASWTSAGLMPPWHAETTDDCVPRHDFVNDPTLTAEDIATLKAWHDGGAPRGNPEDAPPAYVPSDDGLPNLSLEVPAAEATIVEGDADMFVCVVHDPQLTSSVFVNGIHIVPSNPEVAHHALISRVSRVDALVASGGQASYPCFGRPPGDMIHAWAPGTLPLELPSTVGMPMAEDDVLVVQMHYHPSAEGPLEDRSSIQLRFLDEEPAWQYRVQLIGNAKQAPQLLPGPNDDGTPEFFIPANVEDHSETMEFKLPNLPFNVPVLVVGTHMHYVGTSARFSVLRADPTEQNPADECFVKTPSWDFNWQRFYMSDAPIHQLPTVGGGDTIRLECLYNNSMSNPHLAKALEEEGFTMPKDVPMGEETLNEMCIGLMGLLVPNAG